jgi:hypothetical protein
MKFAALCILCSICFCCFADDTNIIAASDWSEPVSLQNPKTGHTHEIRGRFLIVAGTEPGFGRSETNAAMTFVELQNVTRAESENVDVYFDTAKLKCKLNYANGEDVPMPQKVWAWSGDGAHSYWVVLPYNSTIRLFVISGSKSPLDVYPNGWPPQHWSISSSETNANYLSGTLEICTITNTSVKKTPFFIDEQYCRKTLAFPKMKISVPK